MATPKHLLIALDRVTLNLGGDPNLAAPEMLPPAGRVHVERVQSVFDDPNVLGAGITSKIEGSRSNDDLALTFYVRRKVPIKEMDPQFLIPPVVVGGGGKAVYTDVVEVGDVVPEQDPFFGPPPLRCGYSISHVDGTAGTLGAFVRKGGKTYILSNSHVLAQSGMAAIGDAIVYPGSADGGGLQGTLVARLDSFTPFEAGSTFVNTADAALAEVLDEHLNGAVKDIFGASSPVKIGTPVRDMKVVKFGRTTGETESVVLDVDARITVDYGPAGRVRFTGQARCGRYTKGGDSGSIVVDKDTGAIVGLHFAGTSEGSLFTPIRTVMAALNFRM